jgi:hypothetical protein
MNFKEITLQWQGAGDVHDLTLVKSGQYTLYSGFISVSRD